MGLGNLPPGVTEGLLPGNRPEDVEVIVILVLTIGEIQDIKERRTDGYDVIIDNLREQLDGNWLTEGG